MDITLLLRRVHSGDSEAFNAVVPLVYGELKKLAASHSRRDGGSVEATTLVHEAYLPAAGGKHPDYQNRAHFYSIASRVMRQILVDAARSRMV